MAKYTKQFCYTNCGQALIRKKQMPASGRLTEDRWE